MKIINQKEMFYKLKMFGLHEEDLPKVIKIIEDCGREHKTYLGDMDGVVLSYYPEYLKIGQCGYGIHLSTFKGDDDIYFYYRGVEYIPGALTVDVKKEKGNNYIAFIDGKKLYKIENLTKCGNVFNSKKTALLGTYILDGLFAKFYDVSPRTPELIYRARFTDSNEFGQDFKSEEQKLKFLERALTALFYKVPDLHDDIV